MPRAEDFLGMGAGAAPAAIPWRLAADGPPLLESAPGDPDDGLILLYSNENAYGPSAKVRNAITSAAQNANRYPRMRYNSLTEKIAGIHNVSPDRGLLGCGSTEILRVAGCAFLGMGVSALPPRWFTSASLIIQRLRLLPARIWTPSSANFPCPRWSFSTRPITIMPGPQECTALSLITRLMIRD